MYCIYWDSEMWSLWTLCHPIRPQELRSHRIWKIEERAAFISKYKCYKYVPRKLFPWLNYLHFPISFYSGVPQELGATSQWQSRRKFHFSLVQIGSDGIDGSGVQLGTCEVDCDLSKLGNPSSLQSSNPSAPSQCSPARPTLPSVVWRLVGWELLQQIASAGESLPVNEVSKGRCLPSPLS